jgi:hypothetical protein
MNIEDDEFDSRNTLLDPFNARSMPVQCPFNARSMPVQCPFNVCCETGNVKLFSRLLAAGDRRQKTPGGAGNEVHAENRVCLVARAAWRGINAAPAAA